LLIIWLIHMIILSLKTSLFNVILSASLFLSSIILLKVIYYDFFIFKNQYTRLSHYFVFSLWLLKHSYYFQFAYFSCSFNRNVINKKIEKKKKRKKKGIWEHNMMIFFDKKKKSASKNIANLILIYEILQNPCITRVIRV